MKYFTLLMLFCSVSAFSVDAELWSSDQRCSDHEDLFLAEIAGLKFYRPWLYHSRSGNCDTIPSNMYFEDHKGVRVKLSGFALQGIKEYFVKSNSRIILEVIANVGAAGRAAQYFEQSKGVWKYLGHVPTDFTIQEKINESTFFIVGSGSENYYLEDSFQNCTSFIDRVYKLEEGSIVKVENKLVKEKCY